MDEIGARRLIAAILKKAQEDYAEDKTCPEWCAFKDTCEERKTDSVRCDAKQFIHSAWCATLCDGIGIDKEGYVRACIKNHRLNRNTYQYVQCEIRDYKKNKKELDKLKNDLIMETRPKPETSGKVGTGDPTLNKVIRISLDKQIGGLEKICDAIESIYNNLESSKKQVMENFWTCQYTNKGLADKNYVDERTIKRWKQQIVYSVAIKLNYL